MMAFFKYKNMILSLLLLAIYFLGTNGIRRYEKLSNANANVIMTFQEDNGDIIDCFDIYKQPALAHPLLKDHEVQLKPQSISVTMLAQNQKNISSETLFKLSKCPKGYVPIRRTSNDDLSTDEYLKYYRSPELKASQNLKLYEAKGVYSNDKIYGAKAFMSVWGIPTISRTQSSGASIWIADGPDDHNESTIIAGWLVYPTLFNDTKTRLFSYWSVNNGPKESHCYNTQCGFVQVSTNLYIGTELAPVSIFEGQIYEIEVLIFQDLKTRHWWLQVKDELLGYWPKTLFTHLQDGADYVSWGGHTSSPPNEPSPIMGSGHKPQYKNTGKVAYLREMQLDFDGKLKSVEGGVLEFNTNSCYNAVFHKDEVNAWDKDDGWRSNMIYGGPGGCT